MTIGARRGRPEAAEVIWRWRERPGLERERVARLRRGGIVRAVIAAAIGAALIAFDRTIVGSIALSIATITLALALASPGKGYAALERGIDRLAAIVGKVVAYLLLAPVFYLFFVPFRALARRGRRDRLMRELERDRASYWQKRDPAQDPRLERPY